MFDIPADISRHAKSRNPLHGRMLQCFYILQKGSGRLGISANAHCILIRLLDRGWSKGEAWPSLKLMAWDQGVAIATVQRCIAELEEAGLLVVDRRHLRWGSNVYKLDGLLERLRLRMAEVEKQRGGPPTRSAALYGNEDKGEEETADGNGILEGEVGGEADRGSGAGAEGDHPQHDANPQ